MKLYHLPRWRLANNCFAMCTLVTAPLFALAGLYGAHPLWLGQVLQACGLVFTLHHARPYGTEPRTDVLRLVDLCLAALLAVGVVVAYPTVQTALCYAAAAATWRAVVCAPVDRKSPLHAWFHLLVLLSLC